jgi:hypothetical protein
VRLESSPAGGSRHLALLAILLLTSGLSLACMPPGCGDCSKHSTTTTTMTPCVDKSCNGADTDTDTDADSDADTDSDTDSGDTGGSGADGAPAP